MTESSRSADSMQVGLGVPGEVEVDDHVDRQDVDTTSEDIRANQAPGLSVFEVMVNSTGKQM